MEEYGTYIYIYVYIYMDKYMAISMEYHNLEDEHEIYAYWIFIVFFNIRDIPSGNLHGERSFSTSMGCNSWKLAADRWKLRNWYPLVMTNVAIENGQL